LQLDGTVLNTGEAAKVYSVDLCGIPTALKVFGHLERDKAKANHEVCVYQQLESLQGICIPRLLARGMIGVGHFLACEQINEVATHGPVSSSCRKSFISALTSIHSCGVLHNDIKASNLMITSTEQAFFIDFERSILGSILELQKSNELLKLEQLLGA
jgi:tRNA A-37 threonylcarbamoyl transferase component Bud32